MGYDLHVIRTTDWTDAASDPITKDEVDRMVQADPELAWSQSDYADMMDDAGTVVRYFMITWRKSPVFWWYRDQIMCKNAAKKQIIKLVHIARALKARVVGDDGESYDVKKGILGGEKIIITPAA
jgi:hypothetical protein